MFVNDAFEPKTPPQLRLNTPANARRSLARIIRMRAKDEITEADYKSIVYGISSMLGYFKLESDLRIEERIEALEARLS